MLRPRRRPPTAEGGSIPFLAALADQFPGIQLVATGVLGPGSNAHGPNEFLHLPMAKAVTVAVAELVAAAGRVEITQLIAGVEPFSYERRLHWRVTQAPTL